MIVALLAYGLVLYVIIMLTAYPSTLCGTIQRALVLIFAYLETLCALINFSKLPILELRLIGRVERDVTPIAHMTSELTIWKSGVIWPGILDGVNSVWLVYHIGVKSCDFFHLLLEILLSQRCLELLILLKLHAHFIYELLLLLDFFGLLIHDFSGFAQVFFHLCFELIKLEDTLFKYF